MLVRKAICADMALPTAPRRCVLSARADGTLHHVCGSRGRDTSHGTNNVSKIHLQHANINELWASMHVNRTMRCTRTSHEHTIQLAAVLGHTSMQIVCGS